jgi:hypothetical protein
MLDPHARSSSKVGKRRDVARCVDSIGASAEKIVDDNPSLDHEARCLGEGSTRRNADAENHEVRSQ